MEMRIAPRQRWSACIEVPGDKSISHRALMLGAFAHGASSVDNLLLGEDCVSTMKCLVALGVRFEKSSDTGFMIHGMGFESLHEPDCILDAGNSGTTMRLLSGILSGLPFFSCISGDSSLNHRPMRRVIEPLTLMGAKIWARGNNCYAPIAFCGSPLKGVEYTMNVASAQVKSAILLGGLLAEGEVRIREPLKTRDHTELMLKAMGADISINGREIKLKKPQRLSPLSMRIPGDFSSAAFLIGACVGLKGGEIILREVGINPTRTGFLDLLRDNGGKISLENVREDIPGELYADIAVKGGSLQSFTVGEEMVPRMIDELPLIAVLATQAEGRSIVSGAYELRVKETDRIAAMVEELGKMGAKISERGDGFEVEGPLHLKGARVKSHGDHRIAMSLAVAGMFAEGETVIEDAGCVNISFPGFFSLLYSGTVE